MFARTVVAALAISAIATPFAAFASAAKFEAVTVTVNVTDLDMNSPGDKARFELRLKNAARAACANGATDRWARADEARCIEEIIANSAGAAD